MIIHGLQKTTLLDFPGKVACTVFFGGCNLRCPFCHNSTLVKAPNSSDAITEEYFFEFLSKRKNILDGVCITGGEPLMQKDIAAFIQRIKQMGFLVKLDTNGTFPERLSEILHEGLVDYVAMDIKNSKEKYSLTCGADVDIKKIDESMDLLKNSGIDYEFRTTVVGEFHSIDDIESIAKWIGCEPKYFLQSFVDSGDIMVENLSAHTENTMKEMLDAAKKYAPNTALRGI